MKTNVITLQGHEFVVSEPAEQALVTYLKNLQKATRFHPGSYRQNVEALRDVLLEQGGKSISKQKMASAIELVGLPDTRSFHEGFRARFPRLFAVVSVLRRPLAKLGRNITRHWWRSFAVLVAFAAVFMSVGFGFSALMTLQSTTRAGGWSVSATSIGPVRYYEKPEANEPTGWLFGRQAGILYAGIFLAVALLVLRLRRSSRRLPLVLALFACGVLLVLMHTAQLQGRPNYATGVNIPEQAQPLKPRLSYLQQCGDEIQYGTDGMMFRRLRDEGFVLDAAIPTRESDGTIDVAVLCQQYDRLRQNHPARNIVLQYYARNDDGTIRAYDYTDLGEGRSSYGLFIRS